MKKSTHSRAHSSPQSLSSISNFATYLRLLAATKPYWACFVIGIFSTILATGTDSLFAWAIKPVIDQGLVARNQVLLKWLPLLVIAAVALRGVTYFLSNYYIARVGRSVVMDFRHKIFAHLMRLPASFYDRESSGKILALLTYNTEQVAFATTDALLTILQEGFTLIGLIAVMFIISWQLSLLFIITAPLISVIVRFNAKRLRRLSGNVQNTMGDLTHIAEEGIEGYRVVRIFGGEEYETNKFSQAVKLNRHREMKVIATNSLGSSVVQIIASLPIALIIYAATLPALHVSAGSFGAIVAAMIRLLTPLRRLTKVNGDIQKGVAGAHSIFQILDTEPEKDDGTFNAPARVKGAIACRNVSFHYPRAHKKNVLHNISFSIAPGETVALVGHSGGGKSTLVSLLPRFYDVTAGEIFIDNVNIHDYRLADLRKQFAVVSQNLVLFNDTIARNIAYGSLDNVDEAKIIQAAESAHIMEFIKQTPDGLNTMIGENGLLLSGGQRQRIAIARALLKDAPILILDEATSALDTESEFHIQAALEQLMKRRTTIVIAHRLSTVERANKIMVIEKGGIAEMGTHCELLARSDGIYAKLYKMQFKNESAA